MKYDDYRKSDLSVSSSAIAGSVIMGSDIEDDENDDIVFNNRNMKEKDGSNFSEEMNDYKDNKSLSLDKGYLIK